MKTAILFLLLCFSSPAWATAYTQSTTGNWNSAATWGGVGIPGNGDTATCTAGDTLTVPVGYSAIIGTSPATGGTTALTIDCTLIVNASLKSRGPVVEDNAGAVFNAGSFFEFDASLSSSPSTTTYTWKSNAFSAGARLITCNGTSGSPVTISSNAGGGNGYFTMDPGFGSGLNFNCTYTNFTRIGDATNPMFNTNNAKVVETFTHSTFTSCGGWIDGGMDPAGGYLLDHDSFKSSLGFFGTGLGFALNMQIQSSDTTPTGTRSITNSVFDLGVQIWTVGGTFTGNDLEVGFFPAFNSTLTQWVAFSGNLLVIKDTTHGLTPLGTVGPNYLVNLYSTTPIYSGTVASTTATTLTVSGTPWTVNQYVSAPDTSYDLQITSGACVGESHQSVSNTSNVDTFLYSLRCTPTAGDSFAIYQSFYNTHWGFPTSGTTQTYSGNTFEQTGTDNNGDIMSNKQDCTGTAVSTTMITGNLSLPSASLDNPGVNTNLGGCVSPNYKWYGTHNTFYAGTQSGLAVGEQGVGVVGTIQQWQSNITWNVASVSPGGLGPFVMTNSVAGSSTPVTGEVVLAGFNGKFNQLSGRAGTPGGGYDIINPGTGSFGVGDVVGDPLFVDQNRNMWKFGLSVGCTGSRMPVIQCVLDGIAKMNDATGYNPAFSISALTTYVRAGFQPANRAYCGTAHDGTDIGAIPCAGITASGVQMSGNGNASGKTSIQ